MIDLLSLPIGIWIGIGLVAISVIMFVIGWFVETFRTILFIIGIVVLVLSGAFLYFGKIPFLSIPGW